MRYALASGWAVSTPKWATAIFAFFTGEGKSKSESLVRIEIHPRGANGSLEAMQGQTVDFSAIGYGQENPVGGELFEWTIQSTDREGQARRLPNGVFRASRPGAYRVTASAEGVQGTLDVVVLRNDGIGIEKILKKTDAERTDKEKRLVQRFRERGMLISREIDSKQQYDLAAEAQLEELDRQRREAVRAAQDARRGTGPASQVTTPPSGQDEGGSTQETQESEQTDQNIIRKGGPRVDENEEANVPTVNRKKATATMFNRPPEEDGWGGDDWSTADDPGNAVGSPPGSAPDAGAGNGNFRIAAPVLNLGGRAGLDVNLALVYNSRLWNKSGTVMKYDSDLGFPAPGWSIGFGKMIYMGANGGCMIQAADGTRRTHTGTNSSGSYGTYYWHNYNSARTSDGSFIDYSCHYSSSTYGKTLNASAKLPNGTTITYGSPSANYDQIYPTRITDAQGNYIDITYVGNQGPRINTVTDTLGRTVTFNYESDRLISVTGPGIDGTTRTYVRLHYRQVTLAASFSGLTPSVPNYTPANMPWVIHSIYYPSTNTGYWFGDNDSYSSYGMIQKLITQRGMDPATQGAAAAGTANRTEVYGFETANLTDAPTYTTHTETWDQMAPTAAAITGYAVATAGGNKTVTVTRPDGSKEEQTSDQYGYWFENRVLSGAAVLAATKTYFAAGAYGSTRPTRIEATDSLGQTTKTEFAYGSVYNQPASQKEYNYGNVLYRETKYTYENNAAYTNSSRHIFNLVKSVETVDNAGLRLSRTEYQYDNNAVVNGTGSHGLAAAPGVMMHNETSDPHTTQTQWVDGEACSLYEWNYWNCSYEGEQVWMPGGGYDTCSGYCSQYEQVEASVYDPNTVFRGNVTRATTYVDAAPSTPTGAVMYDYTYDVTGNRRTATTNCCEQMSFDYTDHFSDQIVRNTYAYPTSITKGSPDSQSPHRMTQSATYDFHTGVVKTSKDFNGKITTVGYDGVARPYLVTSPTGAKTTTDYGDSTFVSTQTVQLADNTVVSKTFTKLNGRGQAVESGYYTDLNPANPVSNNTAVRYDEMGRKTEVSVPYASGATAVHWSTYTYDHLSRVTEVTAPDGSTSKTFYNEDPLTIARPSSAQQPYTSFPGQTVRSQDAWGRERWARTDAFGRLVEVVEPDPAGDGTVAAAGNTRTEYVYDRMDQLTQIAQGVQTRWFAYDSLGRLTRQKLAEQTATISDAGLYVGPDTAHSRWSDAFKYDAKSNLTERLDARGVKTVFDYGSDPLNRLQSISYDKSGAPVTPTIHDAATVSIAYMPDGDKSRVEKVTTAGVSVETNSYDEFGRVTNYQMKLADRPNHPFDTTYSYDAAGRLTQIEYPKQYPATTRKTITPTYDQASRLTELMVDAQTQLNEIVYNARGQVESLRTGAGTSRPDVEQYDYEATTGLLTGQRVYKASNMTSALLDLTYGYNRGQSAGSTSTGKTGQLTHIVDNTPGTGDNRNRVYEHDALGRLIKAKGGAATGITGPTANWTQDYSYDRYGNKTGTIASGVTADSNDVPSDGFESVTYDPATNRIISAVDPPQSQAKTFDPPVESEQPSHRSGSGGPSAEASPPACDPSHPDYPDCDPTLNEPPVSVPGGPYSAQPGQNIQFNGSSSDDNDGWVTGYLWNFGDGTTSTLANPLKSYAVAGTYNVSLRVRDNSQAYNYAYTTATVSAVPTPTPTPTPAPTPTPDPASLFQYDSAGNQTRGRNGAAWQRFEYDTAGRLVKINDDAGNPVEKYTYGASRNRLIGETSGGRTYYAWGSSSPLVEYTEVTASSTPVYKKAYIYAGSGLLSTATKDGSGEKLEFHHPDRLGTALVTDPAANTSFRQSTLPFGKALGAESTDQTNQAFTSYDRSASTGLDYAVNRIYSQGQSRFTQVDPIGMAAVEVGNPQSNNLYGYVQNMPVDFIDPSGLNMAGPGTRYGGLDPMGVAYYVDGMLSDARTAWSHIEGGGGYIDFADVAGLTVIDRWEERLHGRIGPDGRPTEGSWIEYRNFSQTVHIWGGWEIGSESIGAADASERLERMMNCALGYYGIDPISVLSLSSAVKWGIIALAAGGIPKSAAAGLGLRVFTQPGSSQYTSAIRMLSQATGSDLLKNLANFGKKYAGPIAIASAIIDATAIGICTALD